MSSVNEPPSDPTPLIGYDALGAPPIATDAPRFEEIELETDGDAVTLRHAREEVLLPNLALAVSTAVFVLFAIAGLPWLHVTGTARVLWIVVGLIILACIGLATQARARVTQLRFDNIGLTIDQGTLLDREHVAIVWGEIARIDLDPVDPADAARGMQLTIKPRAGELIHTLGEVGIGDLTEARQILLSRWKVLRKAAIAKAPAPKVDADAVPKA